MVRIPTPRLLPLTIFALGSLLAMKSVTLVRAAVAGAEKSASDGAAAAATSAAPAATVAATTIPAGAAAAGTPVAGAAAAKPTAANDKKPAAAPQMPPSTPPQPPPVPTVTDGERAVLLELRQRREELDARDTAVAARRESTLVAAELRLDVRVKQLETLQLQLEALEKASQQRDDASWQGLVKLYESMKPRDAATIFNDLELPVLLGVVDRMKDRTAGLILAAMQPEKARELTIKLAQLRTKRTAVAQTN